MKKGTEALLREDGRRLILVVVLSFGILFAGAKLCFCGGKDKNKALSISEKALFFCHPQKRMFLQIGFQGGDPLGGAWDAHRRTDAAVARRARGQSPLEPKLQGFRSLGF